MKSGVNLQLDKDKINQFIFQLEEKMKIDHNDLIYFEDEMYIDLVSKLAPYLVKYTIEHIATTPSYKNKEEKNAVSELLSILSQNETVENEYNRLKRNYEDLLKTATKLANGDGLLIDLRKYIDDNFIEHTQEKSDHSLEFVVEVDEHGFYLKDSNGGCWDDLLDCVDVVLLTDDINSLDAGDRVKISIERENQKQ